MKTYTKEEIKAIASRLPRGARTKIALALKLKRQYVTNVLSGDQPGNRKGVVRVVEFAELFVGK